jgi:hypothetical protein
MTAENHVFAIIAIADILRKNRRTVHEAVSDAIRSFYSLADEEGIHGESEVAIGLGYVGRDENENLLDEIVAEITEIMTPNEVTLNNRSTVIVLRSLDEGNPIVIIPAQGVDIENAIETATAIVKVTNGECASSPDYACRDGLLPRDSVIRRLRADGFVIPAIRLTREALM